MTKELKWGAGDPSKWADHGTVLLGKGRKPHKLIYGEHPHSTSDNKHYAILDDMNEPIGFSGHRPLIDINIKSENYLKESDLSGDEIRKGGLCTISFDGTQCYEFFFREVSWALLHANSLIPKILEAPLHNYWDPGEEKRIIGRKIYYREIPSVIFSLIRAQGCIMVHREDGLPYPPPIYELGADREQSVKLDILEDKNIWWWRD